MTVIYEIFRWIGVVTGYPFRWLFFKDKIYYQSPNSTRRVKGGALIITNHFNPLDFVMNVFVFFPRKLWVVASEHAFKNWVLKFGMKFWGGIEANRVTRSLRFISESVRLLKKGKIVQIFPEGHNTDDGTIKAFYPSYIVIAQRADVPIVPVITDGGYGLFKRVHLIVGDAIDLKDYLDTEKPSREDIERLNDIVRQKVLDLRAELDERIAADKKGGKR